MPFGIALAALNAAGALGNAFGQMGAARRATRLAKKRALMNKRTALKSLLEASFDTSVRQMQQDATFGMLQEGIIRQSAEHIGAVTNAAFGAGVGGQSVNDLIHESTSARDRELGKIRLQREFADIAADRERSNLQLTAKNRIAAVQPKSFGRPTFLGAVLSAVNPTAQGFLTGKKLDQATGGGSSG